MWRSVLLAVALAGVLAGCSLGGGSEGAAGGTLPSQSELQVPASLTPAALALMRVSRIPLSLTGGRPLLSLECKAAAYTGRAFCSGYRTGTGPGRKVLVFLRLTSANKPVPTCAIGDGPSRNTNLFCVS